MKPFHLTTPTVRSHGDLTEDGVETEMHRTKAVCEHGRPWYGPCLECAEREFFGASTTKFQETPWGYTYCVSNRDEFFRSHPGAARELTR